MFGQLLVTPTLIDSMDFAKTAPPSWKDRAMKDFVAKIKREKVTYPDWVNKGMEFEKNIVDVCRSVDSVEALDGKGSENFQKVAKKCYGAAFQTKLQKKMQIGEDTAFFFGYSDVEFPKKTIDLKTTLKYRGEQSYLSKNQHKIYLWINGKSHFEYVVAQWESEESNNILAVHEIQYEVKDREKLEHDILVKTTELFSFIRGTGLWDDYYFTFSKN